MCYKYFVPLLLICATCFTFTFCDEIPPQFVPPHQLGTLLGTFPELTQAYPKGAKQNAMQMVCRAVEVLTLPNCIEPEKPKRKFESPPTDITKLKSKLSVVMHEYANGKSVNVYAVVHLINALLDYTATEMDTRVAIRIIERQLFKILSKLPPAKVTKLLQNYVAGMEPACVSELLSSVLLNFDEAFSAKIPVTFTRHTLRRLKEIVKLSKRSNEILSEVNANGNEGSIGKSLKSIPNYLIETVSKTFTLNTVCAVGSGIGGLPGMLWRSSSAIFRAAQKVVTYASSPFPREDLSVGKIGTKIKEWRKDESSELNPKVFLIISALEVIMLEDGSVKTKETISVDTPTDATKSEATTIAEGLTKSGEGEDFENKQSQTWRMINLLGDTFKRELMLMLFSGVIEGVLKELSTEQIRMLIRGFKIVGDVGFALEAAMELCIGLPSIVEELTQESLRWVLKTFHLEPLAAFVYFLPNTETDEILLKDVMSDVLGNCSVESHLEQAFQDAATELLKNYRKFCTADVEDDIKTT